MVETIAEVALPVDERLLIQKNRLCPEQITKGEKRICIVTGIHGDEMEGQYVCYELARRIQEGREHLRGIVDIYPAVNPLGINSITRGIPMFDLDMNRIFPGAEDGAMAEHLAAKVMQDMEGADMCLDIHASNIFLREVPQARISQENGERLLPYARQLNVDFVWIHNASTVMEATFAHSLNKKGIPTVVVEMGTGMRINKEFGEQILDGIFHLMTDMGIWDGECPAVKEPIISTDGRVGYLSAGTCGIFVPGVEHWKSIKRGDKIGEIIDPLKAEVKEIIKAPFNGMVFTLREYPVVSEGCLIARILGGKSV